MNPLAAVALQVGRASFLTPSVTAGTWSTCSIVPTILTKGQDGLLCRLLGNCRHLLGSHRGSSGLGFGRVVRASRRLSLSFRWFLGVAAPVELQQRRFRSLRCRLRLPSSASLQPLTAAAKHGFWKVYRICRFHDGRHIRQLHEPAKELRASNFVAKLSDFLH